MLHSSEIVRPTHMDWTVGGGINWTTKVALIISRVSCVRTWDLACV